MLCNYQLMEEETQEQNVDYSTHSLWLIDEGIEPNTGVSVSCEMGEVAAARASKATAGASTLAVEET